MSGAKRKDGTLARHVVERRLWGESPFFLLDVGCSGGVEQRWQIFGDQLRAIGFDPLVAEIDRLNQTQARPGVVYEAGFVSSRDYDERFPRELRLDRIASRNDDPFLRVSAVAAQSRSEVSYIQQVFNAGAPVVTSDRRVVLDDRIAEAERPGVDFLKIDTDGHDIEALLGAEAIMAAGGIVALKVEVQLHGALHPFANTFSNIDHLLRSRGYTLFDIDTYRYSRTELPAPFVFDLAAQTTSGQVVWGDALYCRDLGSLDYARMWPYEITPERVLKLACVFDLFGLADCAAELLVNRGGFLAPAERDGLLDLLTTTGDPGSYGAHVAAFERDFTSFYPSRIRELDAGSEHATGDDASSKQVRRLRERIADLGEKNAELRERLKARGERIDQLTKRLEQKS